MSTNTHIAKASRIAVAGLGLFMALGAEVGQASNNDLLGLRSSVARETETCTVGGV